MFELGQEYDREELLEFIGSRQQQSGIIWGPEQPGCVIVTSGGKHSKRSGYEDIRNPDGSWTYFGQGSEGNQDPNRYANKLLIEAERSILLFSTREPTTEEFKNRGTRAKRYRFEGVFHVRSHQWYSPSIGPRSGDELLLFHLVPVESSLGLHADSRRNDVKPSLDDTAFRELRSALLNLDYRPPAGYESVREYKRASEMIRRYARLRADGTCEYCEKPAPFADVYGQPFLEVHHIYRLADDGPDSPTNVSAVCPNCHREAHFGQDADQLQQTLAQRVWLKERAIDES